ncbi:hypothetical protein COT75_03690 [Candidatus Beckwithbacteria bacterium CG10_big_fil_rev_8_21_14_0_10_34_10]|uniref:Undecaprenyl-diphosphatase n=1 Tax=Candidatus Beckwithbacteria bacterium CG10_big_fil_rev_8_21_14_0_10_34_10 TaxID=1974495 RepID=A0A2H0WAK5_9BACT|nr:MAG: hypothetical protein COT75_03690 [Candidatus Beckwithbacteria bacterium CG10_big_fil_rev_8_21_14_0_10_34_10]
MNLVQAVFLGLFQGLTEFLPVSSSGHLVIGQRLFGLLDPPVLFDILVHIGTLISIIIFFNKKIFGFYKDKKNWILIIVGSIPAALLGFILNSYIEVLFNSLKLVGLALLVTAGLLFLTKRWEKRNKDKERPLSSKNAFIIGLFQALAIIPGVSRSGSTISAGLFQGINRKKAFDFSFFLGAPAMLGALCLQLPDMMVKKQEFYFGLIGLVIASIVGFLALKILRQVVLKAQLWYFSFYCFILGLLLLVFS